MKNARQAAYHLIHHALENGTTNGVEPSDCGEFSDEAEAFITAVEQSGPKAGKKALDELDGLRRLYSSYDPETDGEHPLSGLDHFTATELLEMELPPLEYVVEGVIPQGTSLLAAAPKIGKSILCLNIAVAVAMDGKALGKADVDGGRVLYIDLDGNKRGMQRRLQKILRGESKADTKKALQRLDITREWPRVDPDNSDPKADAVRRMEWYLKRFPDTSLVIVDTLADVRPKTSGQRNMYETDREALTPFRSICEDNDASSIFIHHTNKSTASDSVEHVSGSTGLPSAVDTILIMRKERGQHDAELQVVPREEEESTLALEFDPQVVTWTLKGDVEEFAKTDIRQKVLDGLRSVTADGEPAGPSAVADVLEGVSNDVVRQRLPKLVEEGKVKKVGYGQYLPHHNPPSHPSHPSHSSHSSHPSQDEPPEDGAPF
jgi:hypothetical protein